MTTDNPALAQDAIPATVQVDLGRIAQDLQIRRIQVENVIKLLDDGNTVPFITRYRKELTGGLDERVIREIQSRVAKARELAERKETILKSIESQGKLTAELAAAIRGADNAKRLEDLYLPFKPKRRTKATEAIDKGLLPLAEAIWNDSDEAVDLAAFAARFVSPPEPEEAAAEPPPAETSAEASSPEPPAVESASAPTAIPATDTAESSGTDPAPAAPVESPAASTPSEAAAAPDSHPAEAEAATVARPRGKAAKTRVDSVEAALEGAGHILAERFSETAGLRDAIRKVLWSSARLVASRADNVPEEKAKDHRDYFEFSEELHHVPPHRVLAVNRGERENVLKTRIEVDRAAVETAAVPFIPPGAGEGGSHRHAEWLRQVLNDSLDRLILPSLEREARRDLTETAERHAVEVFARNLRSLLLQPPITNQTVLAIDPGFRSGCKVAVLDPHGVLLEHTVIYPHPPQNRRSEAKLQLKDLIAKHQVSVVAIGNGTACRETEEVIAEIIAEGTFFQENPGVPYPWTPPADATTPSSSSETALSESVASQPSETPVAAVEAATTNVAESASAPSESQTPSGNESSIAPIAGGAPTDETETESLTTSATASSSDPPSEPEAASQAPPTLAVAEEPQTPDQADAPSSPPQPPSQPEANRAESAPAPVEAAVGEPGEASNPTPEPVEAAVGEPGEASNPTPEPVEAAVGEPGEASNLTPEPVEARAASSSTPSEPQETAPARSGGPKGPRVPKRGGPSGVRGERGPRPKPVVTPPEPHPADPLLAKLSYLIVNEAGASVYSTSPTGREEFPDLDATTRGTISIGRRLQDPLSELVKIEPQHIGVGLYQHDVQAKHLRDSLDSVVESCVNFVGVDLNTASIPLLKHVSGLNSVRARNIFEYRRTHGPFRNRRQLLEVEGIGEATFVQAAGFLKIRDGDHPFDRTWIHPESYEAATKLLEMLGYTPDVVLDRDKTEELRHKLNQLDLAETAKTLGIGEPTLDDICRSLARPDRDPRDELPKPIFKKGVLKLEDLSEGMELKGTVLNVVDFGAFVDIGLKDSGLVHISQLANRYIKSPHDVVSVGDVVTVWVMAVDHDRKRVSLTMVKPGSERPRGGRRGESGGEAGEREPGSRGGPRERPARPAGVGRGLAGPRREGGGPPLRPTRPATAPPAASQEAAPTAAVPAPAAAPPPRTDRNAAPPTRPGGGPPRFGVGGPGRSPGGPGRPGGGGGPGGPRRDRNDIKRTELPLSSIPKLPLPPGKGNKGGTSSKSSGGDTFHSFGQLKALFESPPESQPPPTPPQSPSSSEETNETSGSDSGSSSR